MQSTINQADVQFFQTLRVANVLLAQQHVIINELIHTGEIAENEVDRLLGELQTARDQVGSELSHMDR